LDQAELQIPKVHRLMSLGHDPILAFIFGVMDVMTGTGTYIDKHGDLGRIATSMSPEGLIAAFLKVFLHLISEVFTSAGIQPPFFTLLQLARTKSPFVLGPSGEKVTWTNVARYMYTHGYDLRHFATMGIVPASIEMIVRGWWLCKGCLDAALAYREAHPDEIDQKIEANSRPPEYWRERYPNLNIQSIEY
jgi:hypothetical protein